MRMSTTAGRRGGGGGGGGGSPTRTVGRPGAASWIGIGGGGCCLVLVVVLLAAMLPSARAFAVTSSSGRGLGSAPGAAAVARRRTVGGGLLRLFPSRDGEEGSADDWCAAAGGPEDDAEPGGGRDARIARDVPREARRGDGAPPTTTATSADASSTVQWDVYVDQSRPSSSSRERGSAVGAAATATLDAFVGLAPADYVRVHPALLSKAKARGKGPIVRCIRRRRRRGPPRVSGDGNDAVRLANGDDDDDDDNSDDQEDNSDGDGDGDDGDDAILDAFEVGGVDSVDKVYRILTKHMGLGETSSGSSSSNNGSNNDSNNSNGNGLVDATACECLRWNYQGNAHLERDEVSAAIECYGRALATGYTEQEGVVLLMRSTAYLKRSFQHQAALRGAVEELDVLVPAPEALQSLFATAQSHPSLASALHARVVSDTRRQERQYRRVSYWHSLYEYALLHAAQDSLRATQLLPHSSRTWLRAGDALAELRKLREAARYYERAMEIDDGLVVSLMPVVERLRSRQQFLDEARELGWPEDTLRLSLDVAG